MNLLQRVFALSVLILFSGELFSQPENEIVVPRDTSFTPYSAWVNMKKDFPDARIVKPQLPAV